MPEHPSRPKAPAGRPPLLASRRPPNSGRGALLRHRQHRTPKGLNIQRGIALTQNQSLTWMRTAVWRERSMMKMVTLTRPQSRTLMRRRAASNLRRTAWAEGSGDTLEDPLHLGQHHMPRARTTAQMAKLVAFTMKEMKRQIRKPSGTRVQEDLPTRDALLTTMEETAESHRPVPLE